MLDVCKEWKVRPSEFARWDPDDRHKVVMHQIRNSQRCPSCGTHPDEGPFETHIVTCDACEIKARGEDELEQKRKAGYRAPPGTRVVLRKRRPPASHEEEAGGG